MNRSPLWFSFFSRSIARRLYLIVLIMAVGMMSVLAMTSREVSGALIAERANETRRLVETAYSLVAIYQSKAVAGEMTEAAAKTEALDRLSRLRYDGEQYFWVNDMAGTMLMHPTSPKLVGTTVLDLLDANGGKPFVGMIDVVTRQGSGEYRYYWPPTGEPHLKQSYVKGVDGWNWVIGSGVFVDDILAIVSNTLIRVAAATGFVLVVTILLVTLIGRGIIRPLAGITAAMKRLAAGDQAVEIPGRGRVDEIGGMAAAIEVFRDGMTETNRLRGEQAAVQSRAEVEKQAFIQRVADDFEHGVRVSLDALTAAAAGIRTTSLGMTATARITAEQVSAMAGAAGQASTNVQTVAVAAEGLSLSVAEIGRQVAQSTLVAGQAVAEADRTNLSVQGLSAAARKIGDVVKLISDIASQTNLLALNATIEAARAGDAGKGFAVVASEVKSLANQTAKATEEISAQVTSMQGATSEAVQAIGGIGTTIGSINAIATTIAAAIEQQGMAAEQIRRNVTEASNGSGQVSSSIVDVNQAAVETGTAAGQVLTAAEALGRQAETLRTGVDRFLANIRTA